MPRTLVSKLALAALALSLGNGLSAYQDPPVVFKSDVSLVRVDVQVIDSNNRAISNLRQQDFELRESGQVREIVNFGRENLPLDLVLLLDVSGSMRPHVERIANAAHEALRVLGNDDRVAIMVFDRSTRVSMHFKSNHDEIVRGFQQLLDRESFNGGTDITRGMLDATNYIRKNARRGSRRAIVILTDDMTEFNRDDFGVERALADANTVMSALIAPDAIGGRMGQSWPTGGNRRGGGGGWPGSGGGGLGGLGDIIFGGGIPGGGRRMPGGGPTVSTGNGRLKSAGTSEIARASGGDSMSVDDASALQDTLERIRQSYALYFNAPEGVKQGEKRNVEIALAGRRFPNAELRYRQSYVVTEGGTTSAPTGGINEDAPTVTRRNPGTSGNVGVMDAPPARTSGAEVDSSSGVPRVKRRPAVDDPGTRTGGWRRADNAPASAGSVAPVAVPEKAPEEKVVEAEKPGGFRRIKPGEKP